MPASHSNATLAPRAQCRPRGQATHAVEPTLPWYLPAGHLAQLAEPGPSVKEPGLQSVGRTLLRLEKLPADTVKQSSALVRLVAFEKEPGGHGCGAVAPSLQYVPEMHCKQAVEPSTPW